MIALCLLAANGAFAYDGICSPATDTFSSFVCADPFLKVSTKKMEGALSKILTTLPKQVAIDFQSSEREWLFGIGSRDCGLTDPRDPFQRNAASVVTGHFEWVCCSSRQSVTTQQISSEWKVPNSFATGQVRTCACATTMTQGHVKCVD
jgi:hypothetical protein